LWVGVGCGGLFGLLAWAVRALPTAPEGLRKEVLGRLSESGVAHPVTAVLLNFRGYDTLLEVAVLLLAVVGVWALQQERVAAVDLAERPLLLVLVRWLVPVLVVAAGYLLWIGAFAPGGAFQGGALLGGAIVLAMLGGVGQRGWRLQSALRPGLVVGLAVFVAGAAGGLLLSGHLLGYPREWAGVWILGIEAAALVSIGLTLGLLFLGGRPEEAE